jgi:energy-coupling factor transporter ATP-binding protein EcfA2
MTATRKISLTRIHAINWYGYADSIPIAGNLLLAGVTGSGKSILMDLIQVVLVGDRRLVKFNQSATGAASSRDLKGYVLGDIKEDEGGVTQYMRDSAITYAALEFTWPDASGAEGRRIETWGLRVEYTSAAEQQGRISPWWCEGRLERGDFLATTKDGKRVPRELADWRAFVDERGGEIFAGIEEYRRDMSSPGHLNFDHGILSRLLPTAMSFTFLRSFNEFCRLFILPPDKLNIDDVRSSYRTFQRYEEELAELRKQLDGLREIHDLHQRHEELARDAAVAGYLSAELAWQHAEAQRTEAEKKCRELKTATETEEQRLRELDDAIPQRRQQIEQLKDLVRQTPGGDAYLFIRSENEQLVSRIAQLKEIGTSLDTALAARLRAARSWAQAVAKLPLEIDHAAVEAVERAADGAAAGGLAQADDTLRVLGEAANKAASEVSRAARPTQERLAKLRQELGHLRDEVAALKLGRLPFPTRLLDELNKGLLAFGNEPSARHLCQLCEVKDERWRAAIEVAFTRKFAIVVTAEHYDQAEQIYHGLRAEASGRDAGRESLINPTKALKLPGKVTPGSLAEKIETRHPVATSIVAHLFGDLICCERREQLREHSFAILPDGFMARGAFVERVRHYDNLPFVGERGLKQQLAWKEKQISEREAEERKLRPIEEMVGEVQRGWKEQFENPASLYRQLTQIAELPTLQGKLAANIEKLKLIDRAQFDEWEKQRTAMENELRGWELEQRTLLTNQKHKDVERAVAAVATATANVQAAKESFDDVRGRRDFSLWLARMEEMRAEMLAQYTVDVAVRRFSERENKCTHDADVTRAELVGARQLFAQRFPKFDDLPIQADENAAYDRVLAKIDAADIPNYEAKSKEERRKWEHLFREQVLEKLRAALMEVKNIISLLNTSLNKSIGSSRYFIEHRKNPDFEIYHRMLDATNVAGSDLFASVADQQLRERIQEFLSLLVNAPDSIEAGRLLDYRHYFEYDMLVEDTAQPTEQRRRISVDRQSGKFSGGENQSPYFIAILASYLRAYRRHDRYRATPTLSLVPIDEAFSKLSGERIADCIDALSQLELQGVFSMSTGNIPYAFEKCDHLLVVSKEERRVGRKLKVRNIAVSIARESEEGRQFMRDFE